ncbi:hypothetical protein [Streptacidiphilus sp. EB129]|uniref:hypothetical protein n=1 Tax=Streptacidiphilus sp. EB129 TaxID=3156262 RepID=UPI003517B3BA
MTEAPRPRQRRVVKETALDLVVPLLKASLEPASREAQRPIDSPAGQIISRVVRRDLEVGGRQGTINLATSLVFTLSYLLPVLAEVRGRDPEEIAAALAAAVQREGNSDLARVLAKVLTPASAEVMARDEADFYNLLLCLADFKATHAQAVAHALGDPIDEVWQEIDAGLRAAGEGESIPGGAAVVVV